MVEIGIIGTGIVGSAIGIKLAANGFSVKFVASRTPEKTKRLRQITGAELVEVHRVIEECNVVFITTSDQAIEPLVREYADRFRENQLVIHCSGALGSDRLNLVREKGAKALTIHPLQTFASVDLALQGLAGTHFGIEGDDVQTGEKIVSSLGGIAHVLDPKHKALYHAGACFVSNYLAVLAAIGTDLLTLAGFKQEEALSCLLPLMQGTLGNIRELGLPRALTGPIARGDAEVVACHLEQIPNRYQGVYKLLGLGALSLGEAKGTLNMDMKEKIERMLRQSNFEEENYEENNHT